MFTVLVNFESVVPELNISLPLETDGAGWVFETAADAAEFADDATGDGVTATVVALNN